MLGSFLRASALTLTFVFATTAGCGTEALPPVAPPPAPPPPPTVVAAVAAPTPPPPPLDPTLLDPSSIPLVLEDPRLAMVKADDDAEAYSRAAATLVITLRSVAASPEERLSWLYQLGRLRALGGDPAGAAEAFEQSAAAPWPLQGYARLQAAQWRVGVGQFDAAVADAAGVAQDLPVLAGAVDLVLADALLGKNDFAGAAGHFRSYLAREKHPPQWPTVALRFATALLNHPSEAHAEEAIHLARRVLWEATGGQGAAAAAEIEKQALETLPSKKRKAFERLSTDEQLAKARGLAASGHPREAVILTDRMIKLPKAKKPGEFSCDVWLVRGETLVKMRTKKPEAADAYKGAIEHCAGQIKSPEATLRGRQGVGVGGAPPGGHRALRAAGEGAPRPPLRGRRAPARGEGGARGRRRGALHADAGDHRRRLPRG